MDLRVLSPPEYENVPFGMLCVCMCLYACVPRLEPERLHGFYSYSEFTRLANIGRCPVNKDILVSKIGALQMSPQNKIENSSKILYRFRLSLSNSRILPHQIKLHSWFLQENNGTPSRGPKAKCRFCRNRFYRSNGSHCCSVFCNNDVTNSDLFRFQRNVVKASRTRECLCYGSAPTVHGLMTVTVSSDIYIYIYGVEW
jgi:hypothetical protein